MIVELFSAVGHPAAAVSTEMAAKCVRLKQPAFGWPVDVMRECPITFSVLVAGVAVTILLTKAEEEEV